MATPAHDPLVGTLIAGRFEIEDRLGAGGMGVVYRAQQRHVNRPVAIKVLRPERADDEDAAEQFLREARAVSQLTSPHTVTLIDVGPLDTGGWFLAMELLDGRPLQSKLNEGALSTEEAVKIADQIALSLGEAHARGIVHRDLKPLNVFLARTPGHAEAVKVLDFGLATLVHAEGAENESSGGTPRYMSPEAISGERANPRGDVYALGLILYEMLAGRHPFEGLVGDELLDAQLGTPPPPLDEHGIPVALRKLVERCLAKHPRLRPRDGSRFRDALRQAYGLPEDKPEPEGTATRDAGGSGQDTKATLPSTMSLARLRARLRPDKRSRWLWLAPAAALVLGGVWLQRNLNAPPPPPSTATPPPSPTEPPTVLTAPTTSPSAQPVRPAASTVDILFHSIPDGATVFVDDKRYRETPVSIALEANAPVKVRLTLHGYPDALIELTPSASQRVRHVFKRNASLTPSADPVEQKVDHYLD